MGRKTGYRKGVTISDVAKQADVSVSTVARVMNSQGLVKPETKKRILKTMLDLGYKPPASSKFEFSLAFNKQIALMVVDTKNPFFGELIEYVEKAVLANGYLLTLCIFNNDIEILEKQLYEMFNRNIDGCILQPDHQPDEYRLHTVRYRKRGPGEFNGRRRDV
jgi:DNA-binding LacI/PurR family transcriptional regulator